MSMVAVDIPWGDQGHLAPSIRLALQYVQAGGQILRTGSVPEGFYQSVRSLWETSPGVAVRLHAIRSQTMTEILLFGDEIEQAMDALRYAVDHALLDIAWLDLCPLLEALRTHPDWPTLHARVAERAAGVRAALGG